MGLLLVYDKLNKASHPCLLGLTCLGLYCRAAQPQSPACPEPMARDASSLRARQRPPATLPATPARAMQRC